jgi:hypothetical protein
MLEVGDKPVRLVSEVGGGLPANPADESAGLGDSVSGGAAVNDAPPPPTSGVPPKLLKPPTFSEIAGFVAVKLCGGGEKRELLCSPGEAPPSDPDLEGVVPLGEARTLGFLGPVMIASTFLDPARPKGNLTTRDFRLGGFDPAAAVVAVAESGVAAFIFFG